MMNLILAITGSLLSVATPTSVYRHDAAERAQIAENPAAACVVRVEAMNGRWQVLRPCPSPATTASATATPPRRFAAVGR
jgi:hypothetical protein